MDTLLKELSLHPYWIPLSTMVVNFLVYGLVFPVCWKVYYRRHPPENAVEEFLALTFVCVSILCGAVTISGIIAKVFNHISVGRYFFYSATLGTILVMMATLLILGKKPIPHPMGLKQTTYHGLIWGFLSLVAMNITVILNVAPSI